MSTKPETGMSERGQSAPDAFHAQEAAEHLAQAPWRLGTLRGWVGGTLHKWLDHSRSTDPTHQPQVPPDDTC